MFKGDRSRKLTLVDYGFRLPRALDNRPLMFDEFLTLTPRAYLRVRHAGRSGAALSEGVVVEQIIRPPDWSIPRSRHARCEARWTTSSARSGCARSAASACS